MGPVTLHIGFHKTGTSFLQRLLARHRAVFAPHFDMVLRPDPAAKALMRLTNGHARGRGETLEDLERAVGEILRPRAAAGPLLVSSEEIPGPHPGRFGDFSLYPSAKDYLGAYMRALGAENMRIALCLREPEAWRRSVYNQAVRTSRLRLDYADFAARLGDFSLKNHAEMLRDAFPEIPFFIWEMEQELAAGHPPGTLLLAELGVPREIRAALKPPKRVNESLDADGLARFLALNRSDLTGDAYTEARRALLRELR